MWSQRRKEEASVPQGSSWCGHRAPQCSGRVGQPRWAGRTHHWLSRGRAGSILSPTKGPGSAVSVFVFLRLLEPCLRAALAFSSLQGEVRPYPSPSEGPARQTDRHHRLGSRTSPRRKSQSHFHHTGSPHTAPSPCSKQGQGSSWAHCSAQAGASG